MGWELVEGVKRREEEEERGTGYICARTYMYTPTSVHM